MFRAPPTGLAPLASVTMAAHSMGVPSTEAMDADVELTSVGAFAGEEGDNAPLLRNYDMATPAVGAVASPGVHPLPNSSYTRDSHSWTSKLLFSWVDPVLEKVSVFRCRVKAVRGVFVLKRVPLLPLQGGPIALADLQQYMSHVRSGVGNTSTPTLHTCAALKYYCRSAEIFCLLNRRRVQVVSGQTAPQPL